MLFQRFKFKASSLPFLQGKDFFFLVAIGIVAATFLSLALYSLWHYLRLEHQTAAHVEKWEVIEKSPSAFAIQATYHFQVQGKVYTGKTILSKPYHLNLISAERQVHRLSKENWKVWFQLGSPKNSSLEKRFPAKKSVYALMTLAIFFYFILQRARLQQTVE